MDPFLSKREEPKYFEKEAMSVSPLKEMNTQTLKEQLVLFIRDIILAGKIKPGERLNESRLARDLGVSRIPIREALQQLQEQGLVVNRRRRGMFVVSLTEEEIQKINSLRIILEAEALRLCRAKITPAGLVQLMALAQKMQSSGARISEIEAASLDLEFHRLIWRSSGNEYLEKTLEGLVIPLFAHRVLWRLNREMLGWGSALSQHPILVQFVQGKIDQPAEQVMLAHLSFRYSNPARFSSLVSDPNTPQAPETDATTPTL